MRPVLLPSCLALLLACPALAEGQSGNAGAGLSPVTDAGSLAKAASSLAGAAKDRLLIKDLLGKKLTGADGGTVGTVEDFAVLPGGRLIAALVKRPDGTLIALPFAAVKLAGSPQKPTIGATLPASELSGMGELKSLADKLAR